MSDIVEKRLSAPRIPHGDSFLDNEIRRISDMPGWATGRAIVSKCVFCGSRRVWEIYWTGWHCADCEHGGPGVIMQFWEEE